MPTFRIAAPLPPASSPSLMLLLALALPLSGCGGQPPAPRPWAETATRELHQALVLSEFSAAVPVPEPSSWAQPLCGAGLLAWLRRRRETKQ